MSHVPIVLLNKIAILNKRLCNLISNGHCFHSFVFCYVVTLYPYLWYGYFFKGKTGLWPKEMWLSIELSQ